MKIAACFSGLTRNFEDTYSYFKKNLFDQYDTDVFIYGLPNKYGMDYNLDKLNSLYNPQKVVLNDHTFYSELGEHYNFKDPVVKMWYNILGADNLRREYETENKFEYDYVLRMRFDCFFLRTLEKVDIDLNQIDNNSVSIPYKWNFSQVHPKAKCDMFAIGTNKSMTRYCNLFNNIDEFLYSVPKNHRGSPHAESLLGVYLDGVGLNVIPTESPFEFEYPEEIDIGSNDIQYRSGYRKFAF